MVTDQPTLPWLGPRPLSSNTTAKIASKNLYRIRHQNYQTLYPLAKPPTRRLEGRRRGTIAKRKLGTTPTSRLSISMQQPLLTEYATAEINRMQAKLFVKSVISRGNLQRTVLNFEKTRALQKTTIILGHLPFNN